MDQGLVKIWIEIERFAIKFFGFGSFSIRVTHEPQEVVSACRRAVALQMLLADARRLGKPALVGEKLRHIDAWRRPRRLWGP